MKSYCTQNNGNCPTCSLANYGRDCMNGPIWGGKRRGAGRPPTGRKTRNIYVTDAEFEQIKKIIEFLRQPSE
jgi:hypothetical protein